MKIIYMASRKLDGKNLADVFLIVFEGESKPSKDYDSSSKPSLIKVSSLLQSFLTFFEGRTESASVKRVVIEIKDRGSSPAAIIFLEEI